jgi:hypothetical protein
MSGPLEISLKDKVLFIESLLIPSFNPTSKLDTPEKREEWMRQRANNINWDAGISAELIIRYGTVKSLEEAKAERKEAERLLERAEDYERRQGKTKHHLFTCIAFHLVLVFSCLLSSCIITCCSSFIVLRLVFVFSSF